MGHGGKREGSGRKVGALTRDRGAVAQRLAELGCDPIQAMLEVAIEAKAAGQLSVACKVFSELASYCHPKLSSVETKTDMTVTYSDLLGLADPPPTT